MLHPVVVPFVQESSSDFTLQVSLILTTQLIRPILVYMCYLCHIAGNEVNVTVFAYLATIGTLMNGY